MIAQAADDVIAADIFTEAPIGTTEGEEAIYSMRLWPGGGFSLNEGILPHKKTVTLDMLHEDAQPTLELVPPSPIPAEPREPEQLPLIRMLEVVRTLQRMPEGPDRDAIDRYREQLAALGRTTEQLPAPSVTQPPRLSCARRAREGRASNSDDRHFTARDAPLTTGCVPRARSAGLARLRPLA